MLLRTGGVVDIVAGVCRFGGGANPQVGLSRGDIVGGAHGVMRFGIDGRGGGNERLAVGRRQLHCRVR